MCGQSVLVLHALLCRSLGTDRNLFDHRAETVSECGLNGKQKYCEAWKLVQKWLRRIPALSRSLPDKVIMLKKLRYRKRLLREMIRFAVIKRLPKPLGGPLDGVQGGLGEPAIVGDKAA